MNLYTQIQFFDYGMETLKRYAAQEAHQRSS